MNPPASPVSPGHYHRFADFYPFYLSEHSTPACRRLHFIGTSFALAAVMVAVMTGAALWLLAAPLLGYGLAWIGHFLFEHNRPATFTHPWYSLAADFILFRDMLFGRIKF